MENQTLSLQSAIDCAISMVHAGGQDNHLVPNVKFALAAAILSANNRLDRNGWQMHALRQYAMSHNGQFPLSSETVKRITRDAGYEASAQHAAFIPALERMAQAGELVELAHKPTTALEWLLWRQAAETVKGIGHKTASFAALLMWPFDCPLVPVDRHVVARLGYTGRLVHFNATADEIYRALGGSTGRAYRTYRRVERLVGNEKVLSGVKVSTGVWHWYKWSEWRQATHAETVGPMAESHDLLSPYWY